MLLPHDHFVHARNKVGYKTTLLLNHNIEGTNIYCFCHNMNFIDIFYVWQNYNKSQR